MTKRLTARERDVMLRVMTAANILVEEPAKLADRMRDRMPYFNRDVAMLRSKALKMIEAMTDTIPQEQKWQWYREVKGAAYTVGVSKPGNSNDKFGVWLPYTLINALIEGCKEQCVMCNLDKGQRKACKLKKTLDAIPNDVTDKLDGDCPYYAEF